MYKILIADDEELEREALRFFINESSMDIDQVIECASGTEEMCIRDRDNYQ